MRHFMGRKLPGTELIRVSLQLILSEGATWFLLSTARQRTVLFSALRHTALTPGPIKVRAEDAQLPRLPI